MFMKLILKFMWSVSASYVPDFLNSKPACEAWFSILATIISKELPEATTGLEPTGQPTDPLAREMWPWWKLKKWATLVRSLLLALVVR